MGVELESSLKSFLEDVASKKPTPGGGSVAALAGALAAALTSMVCRLTIGRKGYEEVQARVERLLVESEKLRSRLQDLVVEDARAFDAVSQALKMDRSTPEAKQMRGEALQQALKGAAEVPMETCERCLNLLRVLHEVAKRGNVNALSDTGVAAHLALAAAHGARLNVEINLSSIKASDFVADMQERIEATMSEAEKSHVLAMEVVGERL